MARQVKRVVVVGGGTAGWMSAAYVQRWLSQHGPHDAEVVLVESADIGIIGVGEATIPSLKHMLGFLQIDEAEFMRRTSAGFKNAIKFVNWRDDPGQKPRNYYYHPFERAPTVNGVSIFHYWLAARMRAATREVPDYAYAACTLPAVCDNLRAPKGPAAKPYQGFADYAYHLDAVLFGRYLRDLATARGVRHVVDTVQEVRLDEQGYVRAVKTAAHGEIEGDLFIDCSGFIGLIINKAYKTRFVDFTDVLFCDRAVAMQVPYDSERSPINPFTMSTAMSSGWIWEIPLAGPGEGGYGRRGIGYVYSSRFISDDEAERELRAYIGASADAKPARRLRMRVGQNERCWVKNCIAVGLSGGFIEPLESTGIFLVEVALHLLGRHFPLQGFSESLAERYNELMYRLYEEIRDFIVLHYCTTKREDTEFWRANRHNHALSSKLKADLDVWSRRPPLKYDIDNSLKFFTTESYQYILAGMGYLPSLDRFAGPPVDPRIARPAFEQVKKKTAALLARGADHRDYLRSIHL